jgi:hypothetical protein
MPFRPCCSRVGRLLAPDLCCSCVGRSSPGQRRTCIPGPGPVTPARAPARGGQRRLYIPMPAAARRPAAAGYPLACQRSRCSPDKGARPGMTHRDEQTCADVSKAPSLPTRRAPLRLASSCAGSAYLPVMDVRAGTALRVSYVAAAAHRSAASFAVRGHGRLAVRYGRRPTRRMLRRRPWPPDRLGHVRRRALRTRCDRLPGAGRRDGVVRLPAATVAPRRRSPDRAGPSHRAGAPSPAGAIDPPRQYIQITGPLAPADRSHS